MSEVIADEAHEIRDGLPMRDYLRLPAVSASDLIRMDSTCPAITWAHSALNPQRIASRDTPATVLGTALHALVLEGEVAYADRYAVKPDGLSLATKDGKAWRTEQGERIVLSHDDGQLCRAMADALLAHPYAGRAFRMKGGRAEITLTWTDPETGLRMKARPDWLLPVPGTFDVKSTDAESVAEFVAQAAKLRYYMRAAFYIEAARHCALANDPTFSLIAVSKTPPHPVIVAPFRPDVIEWAHMQNRAALRKIGQCLAIDRWPGIADDRVLELGLPPWAERELQARHERGEFSQEVAA